MPADRIPAVSPGVVLGWPETARTAARRPSEDPLAAARGLVFGVLLGLGSWAVVGIVAAMVIS